MTGAGTGGSLGPALIWCPFPDPASAAKVCSALLDEGLIACANMLPGMISLFAWNGERGESTETGALLKTDTAFLDKAIARLGELHPYDEPAVVGWRCDAALPATAAWLGGLVQ
jgi:periplasmic divalent cation tolerance protein